MGWRKKVRNVVRAASGQSLVQGAKKMFGKPKDEGGEDYRSEAAGGLVRQDVKRQAGGGQINFTQETQT